MKRLLLSAALYLTVTSVPAQSADSLRRAFNNTALTDSARMSNLRKLARQYMYGHPDSCLHYAQLLETYARDAQDTAFYGAAHNLQGGTYMVTGRFVEALDQFARSLDLYVASKDTFGTAAVYNNMGNIYFYKGDYQRALQNYVISSDLEQLTGNEKGQAGTLLNIGSIYGDQDEPRLALINFQRALDIYKSIDDSVGIGNSSVNIGAAYLAIDSFAQAQRYLEQGGIYLEHTTANNNVIVAYESLGKVHLQAGRPELAFTYFRRCKQLLDASPNPLQQAHLNTSQGAAYVTLGQYHPAREYCEEGLRIAEEMGAMPEMRDACNCLYQANKGLGRDNRALAFYERAEALADSMAMNETRIQLHVMEFRKEVAQDSIKRLEEKLLIAEEHARQVRRVSQRRNAYMVAGLLLLVVSVFLYRSAQRISQSKRRIEGEKGRTDRLLLNVLPAPVAEELLATGKVDAREFANVTVLFTDFVGYTEAARGMPGKELVEALDAIFQKFDTIVADHGIQKIKTIGDAYMAAGGLPVPDPETVVHTVDAALEMQTFIAQYVAEHSKTGLPLFRMRAGIHLGPVTAGIVGQQNFQYDIWGHTVNVASRLEQHSAPGKINISSDVYEVIKGDPRFTFDARGERDVKGVGSTNMWFVALA